MSRSLSERRRESFDEVAELYDEARPGYPESLVQDLETLACLSSSSRVLEVGAGTGKLTARLAKSGAGILAVELGANLAEVLRRNVARFSNVHVLVTDYDEWKSQGALYDLVVVATAFHWLNPATRVQKTASSLRPGGMLAVIETHWVSRGAEDRFPRESQLCYAQWDPAHDPEFRPREVSDLTDRNDELENSKVFASILHRRYFCDYRFSTSEYCDLLATFSDIRAFDESDRTGFLSCVANLIETRFQGTVTRRASYELWLAQIPIQRTGSGRMDPVTTGKLE
jgi:SAM-dependent methyltransferase